MELLEGTWGLLVDRLLLRSDSGALIKAYVFKCGISTTLTTELWGLFYDLMLVTTMGISSLIAESDSTVVCSLMQSRLLHTHPDCYLIKRCWELIDNNDWDFKILHVCCEANTATHTIAQLSFNGLANYLEFNSLPFHISSIIDNDVPHLGDN